MDKKQSIQAIVLAKHSYKDTNLIVVVFSKEHGKIALCAQGVKKIQSKIGPFLELGALLELELTDTKQALPLITGAKSIYMQETQKYEEIIILEKALELTKIFAQEGQELPFFWNCLKDFLKFFPKAQKKELQLLAFEIQLFSQLGVLGDIKNCSVCHKKLTNNSHYFDLQQGFICNSCSSSKDLTEFEFIKVFAFLQQAHFDQIDLLQISEKLKNQIQEKIQLFRLQHSSKILKTERI